MKLPSDHTKYFLQVVMRVIFGQILNNNWAGLQIEEQNITPYAAKEKCSASFVQWLILPAILLYPSLWMDAYV